MARFFIASKRGLLPAGGTATLRFYEELNDFLPSALRKRAFAHDLAGRVSVKDVIESLGVPHTEVDLILVNGRSVGFDALLHDGDRVAVYPVFEALDVTNVTRLRPRPLRVTRFVLDAHLGRLARHLRLLGFDTLYRNDYGDEELARLSRDEQRILLTRDRGLLKRSAVTRGAYLRETDPRGQLLEVLRRFDLRRAIRPFRRCIRCNGALARVARRSLDGQVSAALLERHHSFRRCGDCGQVYWPGTHYRRMRQLVDEIAAAAAG